MVVAVGVSVYGTENTICIWDIKYGVFCLFIRVVKNIGSDILEERNAEKCQVYLIILWLWANVPKSETICSKELLSYPSYIV